MVTCLHISLRSRPGSWHRRKGEVRFVSTFHMVYTIGFSLLSAAADRLYRNCRGMVTMYITRSSTMVIRFPRQWYAMRLPGLWGQWMRAYNHRNLFSFR